MTSASIHVLAIDPFHGGSHRAFLSSLIGRSRHRWTVVTGKPVHWKWRMRSAPMELAAAAREVIDRDGYPDVVFCSDMLDLAQWRGILRDPKIISTPSVVYFHENQWTYPISPQARVDHQYGYTNLLTALTADACWFNSSFHRDDFLRASESFIDRMPDSRAVHDFATLRTKAKVFVPGFEVPLELERRIERPSIAIGWVSRWEHDKRPDRFLDLLVELQRRDVEFRLVLLGPRPDVMPDSLRLIHDQFGDRIDHDGFATTAKQYWSWLRRIDVVVSTSDHEFFGIAICEAIWAGAAPALPNRLSYPELVPPDGLYDSLDDAVSLVQSLTDPDCRDRVARASREKIGSFHAERTAARIDDALADMIGADVVR